MKLIRTSALSSLFLALALPGLVQAQDCPNSCPEAKTATTTKAAAKTDADSTTIEVAEDDKEKKELAELEDRLNEILFVDPNGKITMREEFKGTLPFPPERLERMLGAFVHVKDGRIVIKNPDAIRPYLPMMRRFLSQGGLDKLRDLQKLPPEERQKAMQRLFAESQKNEEEAEPEAAPEPPKPRRPVRPRPPARPKAPRAPRSMRRDRPEHSRAHDGDQDRVHRAFMARLERIERSVRRIERMLDEMKDAHGDMRGENRGRSRSRNRWSRRGNEGRSRRDRRSYDRDDHDEERYERRGRRNRRGFDGNRMRERLRGMMRGGEGMPRELRERMRDMMRGGGEGMPRELRERLRGLMEGGDMGDLQELRRMAEEMFGRSKEREGRRGGGMRKMREQGRDMVKGMNTYRRGLTKLMEIMEPGDLETLRKAFEGIGKDGFDPKSMQDPGKLMETLGKNLDAEDMGRLMEVFSEFIATEEGRAMQAELEKGIGTLEGFMNSEEGQKLLERLGGKGTDRLRGLVQGRKKTAKRPRRVRERTRARAEGPRYNQPHPNKPKAKLY